MRELPRPHWAAGRPHGQALADLDAADPAAARVLRKYGEPIGYPFFSPLGWTVQTGCQNWPAEVTNPQRRLHVDGTPPILMTNSRFDPATPYSWGANAARQIGREAVLLAYDGVGHGDYWLSPCARDAIDTYLTTLKTPRKGTHCPAVWPTATPSAERQPSSGDLVNPLPDLLGRRTYR
ncbi:alpha/beta hydrolase [Streptomyces sp. NPDC008086]|uniref:alpha/beta hydrolase n=1 Tax=Streptomyces sp. NPDC008086 TaxID=3364807 RepID=UPI0036E59B38